MSDKTPDHLDFAALMCSRLCHDLVGPVGAVANGAELLAEGDADMLADAQALIANSAGQAVRRLRFYRVAFGASGAASIGWAEALQTAGAYLADHKVHLETTGDITGEGGAAQGILIKVVLNAMLVCAGGIPRGGTMAVQLTGDQAAPRIIIEASGPMVGAEPNALEALDQGQKSGSLDGIDARAAQPFMLGQLASANGLAATIDTADPARLVMAIGSA